MDPAPARPIPDPGSTARDRLSAFVPAAALALAAWICYRETFSVPFLFDDSSAVANNASIRHLGEIGRVLWPPATATTAGRPILNLSFALNYAFTGISVRGFHEANLLIHILCGWTLFGIVRRTFLSPRLAPAWGKHATGLGLAAALLWIVHPLCTESVTYISQRAESLMGLFYLATLYCFIRATGSLRPRPWMAASALACLLGAGTKEVIATAPLVALLYDRAYVAESFREALRRRWGCYLALSLGPLAVVLLTLASPLAERGVGFGSRLSWWAYPVTEARVLLVYLKLAVWPRPLVFDYGSELLGAPEWRCIWCVLTVSAAALAVIILWIRKPALAFPAACFFLLLAPSSSVVPVVLQPMAESRMYLPLAGLAALAVAAAYRLGRNGAFVLLGAAAIALGASTVERNRDYRTEAGIWRDTVEKEPGSSRAHMNYARALSDDPRRLSETVAEYVAALRIRPDFAEAHCDLADALLEIPGRWKEALFHYREAIRINPAYAAAHYNLGTALARLPGGTPEAIAEFQRSLALDPDYAEAHNNLGNLLRAIPGRSSEALGHFERAVWLRPDYAEARNNLANQWAALPGHLPEAIAEYREALRLKPDAEVETNLGMALLRSGDLGGALLHWHRALLLDPNFQPARRLLDRVAALQKK
jgi:tetratricopeptide (TPR) repeat protein